MRVAVRLLAPSLGVLLDARVVRVHVGGWVHGAVFLHLFIFFALYTGLPRPSS